MNNDPKDSGPKKVSKKNIYAAGTILALIISIPGIVAFIVVWKLSESMFTALIVSIIIYFISLGFSVKISKKMKVV
jgi:hypothetical protein